METERTPSEGCCAPEVPLKDRFEFAALGAGAAVVCIVAELFKPEPSTATIVVWAAVFLVSMIGLPSLGRRLIEEEKRKQEETTCPDN